MCKEDHEPHIREKNYNGKKCPYCEGTSLEPSNNVKYVGGIKYFQYVKCNDCNRIWREILEITRFKPCDTLSATEFEDVFEC